MRVDMTWPSTFGAASNIPSDVCAAHQRPAIAEADERSIVHLLERPLRGAAARVRYVIERVAR